MSFSPHRKVKGDRLWHSSSLGSIWPSIRGLASGQKITEHGITAERMADGNVRYSVNVMVDRQRIHRVIGKESDGVTRSHCEAFIEKARTEAREGRLDLPRGRKTHRSFREAADDYVKRLEETAGKNVKAKRRQLKKYLTPFFNDQRLDAITSFTVDRYKKRRIDHGAAAGTVNRELATLSQLINKAVEWKWIKAKPCKITPLDELPGRIVALTDDQATALLKAAMADEEPYCWLFVAFGLNTAMRHSEILASRFGHIDFDNNRLRIPRAKAGAREQPITTELANILKKEREMRDDKDGWVFPSPRPNDSITGHRYRMDKPFRRAVQAAKLDLRPDYAACHAAHRHHRPGQIRRRSADDPAHQWSQDARHGASLHACSWAAYRPRDRCNWARVTGTSREQTSRHGYTEITHQREEVGVTRP